MASPAADRSSPRIRGRTLRALRSRAPRAPRSDRRPAIPVPGIAPEAAERVRQHPYVRLALNGSFSALWAGQLISLFGDRLHQLALVAVVGIATDSALAMRPRLLRRDAPEPAAQPDRRHVRRSLGPQGGPDRQRHPARGTRPAPARSRPWSTCVLVYPMVFVVTTISIFFRPARVAILPRIVPNGTC